MKRHNFMSLLLLGVLMLVGLAGCGGGGSSSPAGVTVIKGTASKGIIYPGIIKVYEVKSDGTKGSLLATTSTNINGTYTATLGAYSGAIQVEASGTYTDEATNQTVTMDPTKPLHAMVEQVDYSTNNNRVVSVTPLTEVSWRNASNNGTTATTPAAITNSNSLVTDLFKVKDITGVEPVRPDTATMASSSQEAQAYTLICASISQMATTATGTTHTDRVDSVLSTLSTEVKNAETSGSMSSTATSDFSAALDTVSLSTDFPSAKDQLASMGKVSQKLTLTIGGTLPAGKKIFAIQGSIALPANVTLRSDSNGQTLSDVFYLLPAVSDLGPDPLASFLAPQQQLDFTVQFDPQKGGVGTGDFALLVYDVASGASVSTADFSAISGSLVVKDSTGADISGLTLTLK